MKSIDIQKALWSKYRSHKYRILNIYFFEEESDWLSFTQTGYSWEIEVKISKLDFKRDFIKKKHKRIERLMKWKSDYLIKGYTHYQTGYVTTDEFLSMVNQNIFFEKASTQISTRRTFVCYRRISNLTIFKSDRLPNCFYFAVPKGLNVEVPSYSGLIEVDEHGTAKVIKRAPFIHKTKVDPTKSFDKMYRVYESQICRNYAD